MCKLNWIGLRMLQINSRCCPCSSTSHQRCICLQERQSPVLCPFLHAFCAEWILVLKLVTGDGQRDFLLWFQFEVLPRTTAKGSSFKKCSHTCAFELAQACAGQLERANLCKSTCTSAVHENNNFMSLRATLCRDLLCWMRETFGKLRFWCGMHTWCGMQPCAGIVDGMRGPISESGNSAVASRSANHSTLEVGHALSLQPCLELVQFCLCRPLYGVA